MVGVTLIRAELITDVFDYWKIYVFSNYVMVSVANIYLCVLGSKLLK